MNIEYLQTDESILQEFSEGLSKNFADYETMSRALATESEELHPLFSFYLKHSLEHSYAAKDTSTGKVIGGLLCNDFVFFRNTTFNEPFSFKMQVMIDLLSQLENTFVDKYLVTMKEKNYLYHYLMFVDKDYKNEGIATNLFNLSKQNAQKNQFKSIVVLLTGPISQHLYLENFGFKKLDEIHYKDYRFQDKYILANAAPHKCVLAIKDLKNERT